MKHNTPKTFASFLLVAIVFALADMPVAEATLSPRRTDGLRNAATTPKQIELQADLAERTRRLADQYSTRTGGSDFDAPDVNSDTPDPVMRTRRESLTAVVTQSEPTWELAEVAESHTIAKNMPALPSSGFGISMTAIALAATAVIRTLKS
ncbi:MAG: hypothetical protein O2904_02525 [bacterium]|nr:hypothetical protein [bacterium]